MQQMETPQIVSTYSFFAQSAIRIQLIDQFSQISDE